MFKLAFHALAKKEWDKLNMPVREQFKKKLKERLEGDPRVEKDRLRGVADAYKIKLRSAGFRLVYLVNDDTVTVYVIAVGRRDKNAVYDSMKSRV